MPAFRHTLGIRICEVYEKVDGTADLREEAGQTSGEQLQIFCNQQSISFVSENWKQAASGTATSRLKNKVLR